MAADDACDRAEDRLARWVRDHARALRGYLLGTLRRHDAADDVLQEVFRRAWQSRGQYREEGRERAYLLRIADRLVVDRSRRLGREIILDDDAWHEVEPAARELPADDAIIRGEVSDELNSALDQLSLAQRRVLLMRYFGDLSFEEISQALDCPIGTALSHCRRGLAALRKLLTAKT
jgi:RNA polymerase sigma-70 factor (ECF subfamily)